MHDARKHPAARRTTPEKFERDAKNIRTYARFAIVLAGDAIEVIDNGYRRTQGLPYAKIIAVLGSAQHGESLLESNLLEIGYSRTRPYACLSGRPKDKFENHSDRRWFLKSRPRARFLTDEEMARVYPYLVECIATIVQEIREGWKTKGAWYVKKLDGRGPGAVERGIYFTVSHSDILLHIQFMREDARHREDKYIRRHASWIRQLCKKYTSLRHSPGRLKSFVNARRIAELLSQGHYTPLHRVILLRSFDDDSRERILLESVVKEFSIDVSLTEHETRALDPMSCLPELENLRCYRIPQQPTVHARDATVFEIFLEENHRKQLEREDDYEEEIPF